jgi:hypothetical protein
MVSSSCFLFCFMAFSSTERHSPSGTFPFFSFPFFCYYRFQYYHPLPHVYTTIYLVMLPTTQSTYPTCNLPTSIARFRFTSFQKMSTRTSAFGLAFLPNPSLLFFSFSTFLRFIPASLRPTTASPSHVSSPQRPIEAQWKHNRK